MESGFQYLEKLALRAGLNTTEEPTAALKPSRFAQCVVDPALPASALRLERCDNVRI